MKLVEPPKKNEQPPKLVCFCQCTKQALDAYSQAYRQNLQKQLGADEKPKRSQSKTGLAKCTRREDCVLGHYFHISCCDVRDPEYWQKKSKKRPWTCLACREHGRDTFSPDRVVEVAAEVAVKVRSEVNEAIEAIEENEANEAKEDVEMEDQSGSKEVAQVEEPVVESIITLKPYRDPSNSK